MSELPNERRDAIVAQLRDVIAKQEADDAEYIAMHFAFEVVTAMCFYRQETKEQARKHIAYCFDRFLEATKFDWAALETQVKH